AAEAQREAERQAREARELEEERLEEQKRAILRQRLENAFERAAGMSHPDPIDAQVKQFLEKARRRSGSHAPETDSAGEAPPPTRPATEEAGGCSDPSELYVSYGDERSYPAPASYSSGRLMSECGGPRVWSFCVDPEVWRAHKAQHGPPPPIQECVWTSAP